MRIGQFFKPDLKDKQECDIVKLLKDWLLFASDVQINDAAGDDWLSILRQRTEKKLSILSAATSKYMTVDDFMKSAKPTNILKEAHEEYLKEINSPEWIDKQLKKQSDVASLMNKVVGAEGTDA